MTEHVDVLIVGAGISGIGAGYRLQTMRPTKTYAILEARDAIGGTWDLFRYPGVRSDSDMFTLGFPFEPWRDGDSIADGDKILAYLQRVAAKYGIAERVRLGHRVVGASWSSDETRWTVTVERDGQQEQLTCSFLHLCSGYYDYERGNSPHFPGQEGFEGRLVHPQFWPEDLAVAGRDVVVIGSGATAVTLVPALVGRGAHVTMLQRSPSWVMSLPRRDRVRELAYAALPQRAAAGLVRSKNVLLNLGLYQLTRRSPRLARRLLLAGATKALGDAALVRPHFTPTYDPWDQRLCVVPDGDLFDVVRRGRAEVVTDTIERFTPGGLRLTSGRELAADVIVTATGLRLRVAGGIELSVDGEPLALGDSVVYRGTMLSGVPNLALSVGYVSASWTLRSDLAAQYVCRLLAHMDERGWRVAVPVPPTRGVRRPLLPLTSGYIQRAAGEVPQQGEAAPWVMRQNYLLDRRDMLHGDVTQAMSFR